jgi:hypothetical protein
MPRIRTIKPSFWSHPLMGKLPDAAKCMALALLNYADDEGFFYAAPRAVRSFCRPFDNSSLLTMRSLKQLEATEYILIQKKSPRGALGRIVHFTKHQSIDKPTPSEIKQYWTGLDERSTSASRWKGKEGNIPIPLPPSLKGKGAVFENQNPKPQPRICMRPGCNNPAREANCFCSDICEQYSQDLEQRMGKA